ncbi:hypothetical protein [Maricaulis sp.]|uniref:hypothetical protein n=1 Tax=Maricaulis sp. TaxID=1486257 RepID=UPI002B26FAE0|nr:hypothetical protein [Maricaulis sp.]
MSEPTQTPGTSDADGPTSSVDDRIIRVPAGAAGQPSATEHPSTGAQKASLNERAADAIDEMVVQAGALQSRVRFNASYWICLVILVALSASGWFNAAVVTGSEFRIFRITGSTILDPEPQKMTARNTQMIQLIEAISREQEEGEYTLAFRQAELSFYGDLPFIYSISESIAEIYEIDTPAALFEELQRRNIRYFALPSYPRAELENSQFEPLLGNPDYVQLLYELDDYRLFELRDAPESFERVTLIREDFERDPDLLSNWALSMRPIGLLATLQAILSGERATFTTDRERGYVETRRDRSYRARPGIVDILQRGELAPGVSPFAIQQSDFDASRGTLQLVADIEGDGYFEVLMTAYDRSGSQISLEPQVLWNGVLFSGERRTIHAQFTDLSQRVLPSALGDQDRLYRIFFQIRDGGYLRLYNWEINHFPEVAPTSSLFTDAYLAPLNNGWSHAGDELTGRELYFTTVADDPDLSDNFTPVRFRRYDSRPISVRSPAFSAPMQLYSTDFLETSTRLSSTIRPAVHARTRLAGTGVVNVTAIVRCSTLLSDQVESADANRNIEDGTMRIPLGTILLDDADRDTAFTFDVPCLPQLINFEYTAVRNTLLVRRDNTLSDIQVLDLDASLRLLDISGRVDEAPFTITTQQINEYRERTSPVH